MELMTKKVLAIIPARGGSKGLPRKNILDLEGKPLIAWTIEAALNSKYIDQVVVSTDDQDISDISRKYSCEIIKRPVELSGDRITMLPVIRHALEFLSIKHDNIMIVLLQPTSPLRSYIHIDSAISMLTSEWTSVVSVCEAEHTPHKMYNVIDSKLEDFTSKKWRGVPRQEIETVYRENGAIFVFDSNQVVNNNTLRGDRPRAFIMDTVNSIDIDTSLDLMIAGLIIKQKILEKV
jgi:CMP-N,N'-diacetyllegionaminic acid synthase